MGELQHLVSGGCLRSISVTCFQWALSSSAFWITNTPFIVAVTRSLLALGTLLRMLGRKCSLHPQQNPAHLAVRLQLLLGHMRLIAAVSPRRASEITSRVRTRQRSYFCAEAFG